MAIYRGGQPTLTGQGEPTAVQSLRASASFLPIFGLQPIVGRGFTPADDRAGAAPTVLLSEGVLAHAASAPIPPSSASRFCSTSRPTPWSASSPRRRSSRTCRCGRRCCGGPTTSPSAPTTTTVAVAKLKPGVPLATAQADLDTISARLEQQYPAENKDWGALVAAAAGGPGRRRPAVAARAARRGRAGAAHRLRQSRQPAAGAHARPGQGDRAARRAGRQPGAGRPAAARRGRAARDRRRRRRVPGRVLRRRRAGARSSAGAAARAGSRRRRPGAGLHRRHLADHRAARGVLPRLAAERPRRQRGAQAGRQPRQLGAAATAASASCWWCPRWRWR